MDALLPAMLLFGLASGLHCVGMCGGIVTAFSARRVVPIAPPGRAAPDWRRPLVFNTGRIATYALGGAAAGALGGATQLLQDALPAQIALFVLAQAVLILAGLYLLFIFAVALVRPKWVPALPLEARIYREDNGASGHKSLLALLAAHDARQKAAVPAWPA